MTNQIIINLPINSVLMEACQIPFVPYLKGHKSLVYFLGKKCGDTALLDHRI